MKIETKLILKYILKFLLSRNRLERVMMLITLAVCTVLSCQQVRAFDLRTRFITTEDGLPNNTVRDIFQDSKGFIWLATRNGLVRYDGSNFKVITPSKDGKPGLANRGIVYICEDKHGYLWVKSQHDKYSCYDPRHDRFVDFTGDGSGNGTFHDIKFFPNCTWLFGTNGCARVTYKEGRLRTELFTMKNRKLLCMEIRMVIDCGRDSWLIGYRGLYLYKNGKIRIMERRRSFLRAAAVGGKPYFVEDNGSVWTYAAGRLRRLATIPNVSSAYSLTGQMTLDKSWYLFTNQGGYVLDTRTGKLGKAANGLDVPQANVKKDNRGDYWLFNKTGTLWRVDSRRHSATPIKIMSETATKLLDQERYGIVNARNGIIWISTGNGGLFAFNTNDNSLSHFTADGNGKETVQSNSLLCATEDKTGNIWIGTSGYGLSVLTIMNSSTYRMPLENMLSQPAGKVRMIEQTPGGIIFGNNSGHVFKADAWLKSITSNTDEGSNIYAAAYDANGQLWLGSRNKGVCIGGKWYRHDDKNKGSLSKDAVYDIVKDRRGRMWIATLGGGINLAVPQKDGSYAFRTFFADTPGRADIRCLHVDRNGYLWAGTSDGLIVFNPDRLVKNKNAFSLYNTRTKSLNGNEIRSIFGDSRGNIWITETGEGVAVCTPKNNYGKLIFRHYGTENGLINGMTQAFAEDRNGRIWISTEYGLSCFTPKTGTFSNFILSTTMAGNMYSENSAATLKDGRIIFGTDNGLAVLDPSLVKGGTNSGRVLFTDMTVNGSPYDANNEDNLSDMALPYTDEIELKHNQNSLTIYFSTLNYSATTQTQYTYRLEGYDKQWSRLSKLNFATFRDLPPGTYYLHVKATGHDGNLMKQESVMKIVITPPLWATPFAYIVYIIFICLAAYFVLRILRKLDALRTQMKVDEQVADYKLMFFTNISHEFRTPLTLIQAAMERMRRAKNSPQELSEGMTLMDKSVQRMLRLINELLEFRKAEKGKLTLTVEDSDVIKLLKGYFNAFTEAAKNKNITYTFEPEIPSYTMPVDRGKLDKIVYNLLSNAFKYTPEGGTIVLKARLDKEKNRFCIAVTDTGIGIKPEQREKMFTRFASSKASRNSIGIGLHLVHELVSVHKGTIRYDENPGGGSVFTVELPSDGSFYSDNDYIETGSAVLETESNESLENGTQQETKAITTDSDAGLKFEVMNDRTILIIEDDDDVRSLLVSELSRYANVVAKADGTTGYNYARENDVDLILCDVMMPGMDGFEVTRRLKEDFATSHIPIILLTALGTDENKLKGLQSGADSYITKPFSIKLLLTRVFKTIEQREKLKEKFSNDITAVRPLISTTDADKVFVDKLTEVIDKNLTNADFSVEDFASEMSTGRSVLFRKVKGVTGYTPKEYLRIMRMKKAAELLLKPEVNVSEVAYAVGLNDPFYFSKCFKQQFGVSPSAYKKNGGIVSAPENNSDES